MIKKTFFGICFLTVIFGLFLFSSVAGAENFTIDNMFVSEIVDNQIHINFHIANNKPDSTGLIIAGIYSTDKRLIDFVTVNTPDNHESGKKVPVAITYQFKAVYSSVLVKAFVFDTFPTMKPLSNVSDVPDDAIIYINPAYAGTVRNGKIDTPYTKWEEAGSLVNGRVLLDEEKVYLQKRNTEAVIPYSIKPGRATVMGAYGSGNLPVIKSLVSNTLPAVNMDNVADARIQDIKIFSQTAQCGIYVNGALVGSSYGGQVIERCEVTGSKWGIRGMKNLQGLKILYTSVHDIIDDGMFFDSGNVEIGYCHIYNVNMGWFGPNGHDQTVSGGDNIQFANNDCSNVYIHHNLLDHSSTGNKSNIIMGTEVDKAASSNIIIEYNHLIMDKDIADVNDYTCVSIYIKSPLQVVIRNNIIEGAKTGIKNESSNMLVYNNLFSDLFFVINNKHVNFYNNTITNIAFHPLFEYAVKLEISAGEPTPIIKNNIWYLPDSVTGTLWTTNTTLLESDYNCFYPSKEKLFKWGWYATYDSLSKWTAASGRDFQSISADPKFVNPALQDYRLMADSPCKGTGTAIAGITKSGVVDMGCDYDDLMRTKISNNNSTYLSLNH